MYSHANKMTPWDGVYRSPPGRTGLAPLSEEGHSNATRDIEASGFSRSRSDVEAWRRETVLEGPGNGEDALRIHLFGGFRLNLGSESSDDRQWRLRKARSLVKLLALTSAHRVHRGFVTDILWPDVDSDVAANNLHKVLHSVRRTLEPNLSGKGSSKFIHLRGEFVSLEARGGLWIDADEFRLAAVRARQSQQPEMYERAISLYTGDLLPEDRYESWVVSQREELEMLYMCLLIELAELHEMTGNALRSIDVLQHAVEIDPAHEEAQIALMRVLTHAGHRQRAMRQYKVLRTALRLELDVDPSAAAETLYRQILERASILEVVRPVPQPPVTGRQNPCASRAPLVGRARELQLIDEILDGRHGRHGRSVLFSGSPGSGKTRLAQEAIRQIERRGIPTLHINFESRIDVTPLDFFIHRVCAWASELAVTRQQSPLTEALLQLRTLAAPSSPAYDRNAGHPVGAEVDVHWRVVDAVTALFGEILLIGPLAVIIDDIDLAGEVMLRIMKHLGSIRWTAPVLYLMTTKDEPGPHATNRTNVLSWIGPDGPIFQVTLTSLEKDDIVPLVMAEMGGIVDRTAIDAIYEASAGNPRTTKEVIRAMRGRGWLQWNQDRWKLHGGDDFLASFRVRGYQRS